MARTAAKAANPARTSTFRKPRAERWEQLIEAAAEIFYEKGYDATTLQEIAERVGILKGSIYYYIKTKVDLRDHLLLDVHDRGIEMIRAAADTDGSSLDRLAAMIRGHVGFFCTNVAKTTVYLHELRRLDPNKRKKLLGAHTYRDVFQEVIEKGQEEGLILPQLDPKLTSQAMLSSLNSVYHWYRSARSPSAIPEYFVLTILRGHATDKGILATYATAR